MANTQVLKQQVEDYVREELGRRYRVSFEKKRLPLPGAENPIGDHEFDAVAVDRSVVAGVISSAPKTSGGRRNTGAVHHATGELYYLSLVAASHRILVCTNEGFRELMESVMKGRLAKGLEIAHVPLPADLNKLAEEARLRASNEMSRDQTPRSS